MYSTPDSRAAGLVSAFIQIDHGARMELKICDLFI